MNRAVWKQAVADAWPQLVISAVLIGLFAWVFVWLQSLFKLGAIAGIFSLLPDFVHRLVGLPLDQLVTTKGRLSFLYVHLIPVLVCIGWALGRGSGAVSGRIARGTMELLATLPVRRVSILFASAVVSTLGAAVLCATLWLGNGLGIATVELEGNVSVAEFLPGAVNLFAMTVAFTAITTLLSSLGRDRWPTVWLAGGFFVLSAIVKMVARLWEHGAWLAYASFLSAFEPQQIILQREHVWAVGLKYDATLLGLGLVCFALAGLVFSVRDIPVPR